MFPVGIKLLIGIPMFQVIKTPALSKSVHPVGDLQM